MIKAGLSAALSIALAACASTSHKPSAPSDSSAPATPVPNSSNVVPPVRTPRAIMVDLALSMLGQPYRYGGSAPGGFDCSGLVVYAATGAGIRVPRTALEQSSTGTAIARGDLQPGDLVFMHLAHKELHVGIAIDGERFVHAPSRGGYVRIDSLAAPPYSKGFVGARRVVAPSSHDASSGV